MSRFPLFPLLLSFSTTLQSACLQDKCSVQPFKDNDAECMPDMTIPPDLSVLPDGNNNPDMTKLASFGTTLSYGFDLDGVQKRVDSIGMIDVKRNEMNNVIQIGQIGVLLIDSVNPKVHVVFQNVRTISGMPAAFVKPSIFERNSVTVSDLINSGSFSRSGMTYFVNEASNKASMFFVPWFSNAGPILISNKTAGGPYFSLSSDVDARMHAVISAQASLGLLASRSFVFYGDNLIEQMPVDMGGVDNTEKYRVLVGNLDRDQEPELITWDKSGMKPLLFKYDGNAFVEKNGNVQSLGVCGGIICPVALGDLNQDGLSDLIVADSSSIKIYYASGSIDNPFPMVRQVIPVPAATPVQAIAVSIPSGDDPPKLVWATSSYDSTSSKNTIKITVLTNS